MTPDRGRIVLDARTVTGHFPGIGRYVAGLADGLHQIAPELDLALLCDSAAPAGRLGLPPWPQLDCPVSPFALRQQWAVPRCLHPASLYHSPYYLMPYRPGVPTVLTVHDLIPLVQPACFTALQRLIFWLAHALALRAASAIVAISQATRADLVHRFRVEPRRITVTPEAAGPHFVPATAAAIAACRQQYGLPEQYVLFLGSNKPHKNLVRLVESWHLVVQRRPADRLVVAGHWDARYPEARQRAEALGLAQSIHFAGPVPEADLPALYSGATLFVFPSLYEGFGLPVLEAMACGTPVLCSRTSSLPEVAGDAGLLVDPLQTQTIAEGILSSLGDSTLREAMRQRGLARAAEFSWQHTARETLAVYNDFRF